MIASLKYLLVVFLCVGSCYAQTEESLTVGPGDVLHIKVLEAPELEQSVRVTDAGRVALMLGGSIRVTGLTVDRIASAIRDSLVTGHYVLTPHVTVTLDETATKTVTILGQVHSPGGYTINTPRRILDIVAMAGGLTEDANRRVTIERGDSHARTEVFLSNNANTALDQNVEIFPGDTVLVPKVDLVYMLGDVQRPGGFPLSAESGKTSVLVLLALAGGTAPSAVPSGSRLIRKYADGTYKEIPLNISKMEKGKIPDFALQANDIVFVPFSYVRNMGMGISGVLAMAASASIYRF